jgi:hypothetical protein
LRSDTAAIGALQAAWTFEGLAEQVGVPMFNAAEMKRGSSWYEHDFLDG